MSFARLAEEREAGVCGAVVDVKACSGVVYRCGRCGHTGCAKLGLNQCSRQAFKGYLCLRCGMLARRDVLHAGPVQGAPHRAGMEQESLPGA